MGSGTRLIARAAAVAACAMLGACSSSGGGSALSNIFSYGGPTVPPAAPPVLDDVPCPRVDVIEGGSAYRTGGGDVVRTQLSIANLARECGSRPDGSIVVKVGVEGRALVGPGGAAGRYDAPIRFVVRRGERVFMTKVRRVAGAIPSGDTQSAFTVVEDGLVVPPGIGDYEIEVGFGAAVPARRGRG